MGIRTKFNPMGANGVKYYTLTVTTSPANATCVLTYDGVAHTAKTATVKEGTVVSYSVSYSGYTTQTGSWTITSNTTKSITLSLVQYTVSFNSNESRAALYWSTNGSTFSSYVSNGSSVTFQGATTIYYYVRSLSPSSPLPVSSTYSVYVNRNMTITVNYGYYTTTNYSLDSDLQMVGSPSITSDGLMTNISTSNYVATINPAADYMSETNYEIQLKFKVSQLGTRQFIFANRWPNYPLGVNIEVYSDKKLRCVIGYSSSTTALSWKSTNVLTTNTWYYVNLKNNNNTYTITYNSGGSAIETSTSTTRKTVWSTASSGGTMNYGRLFSTTALTAQYATIDLKNSWVKSNGSYIIYNVGTSLTYYWNSPVIT